VLGGVGVLMFALVGSLVRHFPPVKWPFLVPLVVCSVLLLQYPAQYGVEGWRETYYYFFVGVFVSLSVILFRLTRGR